MIEMKLHLLEMYKNTYGFMYFYTFFNNNTMHLIVLLLKIKQLKEVTSFISTNAENAEEYR